MTQSEEGDEKSPKAEDERIRALSARIERIRSFVVECQGCQALAPMDWHYCISCGARLATACPHCGNPLPPLGGRFCPHCGILLPKVG